MVGNMKYPHWIVLQLLHKCNLRCKMCYEWGKEGAYKSGDIELSELDYAVLRKVIHECKDVKPYYDLFGGEPLLYSYIAELLEEIKYYGSTVDMPTNGTLLEENAEMLVSTQPNRIWVSIDGPKQINNVQRGDGVFQKSIKGIEKIFDLRESKGQNYPKVGISCIVTSTNYKYLEELFLNEIDLDKIDHISIEAQLFSSKEQCDEYRSILRDNFEVYNINYAQGMIWDKKDFSNIDYKELSRQIKNIKRICDEKGIFLITYPKNTEEKNLELYFRGKFSEMTDKRERCALPWIYAEITAEGNVAPCHTYYDLTFGNIYEESLLEIWNSEKYKKFRSYMRKNMLPICTACSRYYAYNTKGEIMGERI